MFKPSLGFILLFVANPPKRGLFYQELFGIKPIEESPTFVMFALTNGVMLGLWSKYTAEPRVEAPAGALEICFPVDNVDALYESWGKKMSQLLKSQPIWILAALLSYLILMVTELEFIA